MPLPPSSGAPPSSSYQVPSISDRLAMALVERYRVERELGAGGMATVYLAHDIKHDRKVALKVLKPELSAVLGADRFVVEIKTTASLQHPHILPLFDSGIADGFLYYVMPYIEGETLRGKLNRETQLAIDEALRITTEIADALDYAHRHGVVHRDIKPENILLHDGRPMVADFGIALAVSAAAGGRMTETGLSLGTPHYMSPEQATAEKDITARSDVYSLASVLYEMLAGVPPHSGGSAQQIIMRIITDTPRPVTDLRKSVAPNVASALARALEKLPADRFASAKAFGEALVTPGFTYTGQTRSQGFALPPEARDRSTQRPAVVAAGATMLLVAGLVAGMAIGGSQHEEPRVLRFPFTLPGSQRLATGTLDDAPFALSPDGRMIAAVVADSFGVFRLQLQSLDQLVGTPLPGTDGANAPFFSADGKWIGFHTRPGLSLKKIPITGGAVSTLVPTSSTRQSASWGDDGTIVYVNAERRLSRVSSAGGAAQPIAIADSTNNFLWPVMLPGSRHVLAERCERSGCRQPDLVAIEVATGNVTVVVPNATRGWYAPSGHLVYATVDRAIYSVEFAPKTLTTSGEPIALMEDVETTGLFGTRVSIATDHGTMAYQPSGASSNARVVAVDRSGRERTVVMRPGEYSNPRWSPDRRRIAVQQRSSDGRAQIWVYDVASETFTQLTREGDNIRPTWSPDGERIAYVGQTLMWMRADGSTAPEKILESIRDQGLAPNWTRDGRWIIVDGLMNRTNTGEDVFAVPTTGKQELLPVVTTAGNDQTGSVSPDGKWIAYTSDESDGNKVYVRPFRSPGGRFLVSTGAATQALWVSNRELAYVDNQNVSLVLAELQFGTTVQVSRRTRLFDVRPYARGSASWWDYDVSRDGREFLFVRPDRVTAALNPIIVFNWTAEITRRTEELRARR